MWLCLFAFRKYHCLALRISPMGDFFSIVSDCLGLGTPSLRGWMSKEPDTEGAKGNFVRFFLKYILKEKRPVLTPPGEGIVMGFFRRKKKGRGLLLSGGK